MDLLLLFIGGVGLGFIGGYMFAKNKVDAEAIRREQQAQEKKGAVFSDPFRDDFAPFLVAIRRHKNRLGRLENAWAEWMFFVAGVAGFVVAKQEVGMFRALMAGVVCGILGSIVGILVHFFVHQARSPKPPPPD